MKRIVLCICVSVALLFFGAVAGSSYVIFNARITGGDGLYYMEIAGHIHIYEGGAEAVAGGRADRMQIGARCSGLRTVERAEAVAGAGARAVACRAAWRACFTEKSAFPELFTFSTIFSARARARASSYICRAYTYNARAGARAVDPRPFAPGALPRSFM